MTGDLTADEICSLLQLEPNATCGFVRVTFGSKLPIAAGGLPAPFAEARPLGSALYFLVTPGAPVRLHRIRNDQLYHYYLGDPLEAVPVARRRHYRAGHRRTRPARRPARTAAHPGQHVPHGTAESGRAAGSWAPAPNGRASFRRMWKSAISTNWPVNIPPLPPSCAPSPRRCGLILQ